MRWNRLGLAAAAAALLAASCTVSSGGSATDPYTDFSLPRCPPQGYGPVPEPTTTPPTLIATDPSIVEPVVEAVGGGQPNGEVSFQHTAPGEVLFSSDATDLGVSAPYDDWGIFSRDTSTGDISLVFPSTSIPVSLPGVDPNRFYLRGVSADGRHIAFSTNALVGSTHSWKYEPNWMDSQDLYVYDRQTETLELAVVDENGDYAGKGHTIGMTPDARYVFFMTGNRLSSADLDNTTTIYRWDRLTGDRIPVSVGDGGLPSGADTLYMDFTPDGRYVAFTSRSWGALAEEIVCTWRFAFVHDIQTNETDLVSRDNDGLPRPADNPRISDDGRYVVFTNHSYGFDLLPGVESQRNGILRDRQLETSEVVTWNSLGQIAQNPPDDDVNTYPLTNIDISPDGTQIVYTTESEQIPGDIDYLDDTFIYDPAAHTLQLVSINTDGSNAISTGSSFLDNDTLTIGFRPIGAPKWGHLIHLP